MPRASCKFLACLFTALTLLGCTRTDDHATGAIEKKYAAFGPQNVTEAVTSKPCDHRGNRCDLYYPTNLAAGIPHPIITWGNGTGGVSSGVLYFLRHLASFRLRDRSDERSVHRRRNNDFGCGELHGASE